MQLVKPESYIFCKAGTAGIGGAAQPLRSNGAGRAPRNPGKPLKNGLLAIFKDGFSGENPRMFLQTFDAPSLALDVLEKWQDVL